MKKLLLFLLGIVMISSCTRDTTTYLYRVKFVSSNIKDVVTDTELGTATTGSYLVGDTLHVNRDLHVVDDARFRKAVVIAYLGQK